MDRRVLREVVLTGGPCAGKTTALGVVAARLRDQGWRVLIVPEAATLFVESGVDDLAAIAARPERRERFQAAVLAAQASLRRRYQALAGALGDERVVLLYDRAECDTAAYVGMDRFLEMLTADGRTLLEVRDSYDAVVHLVTAADGAAHAYTLENNRARTESPERARELDAATLAGWVGHPRLTVVGNAGGFEAKLDAVHAAVLAALAEPAPLEVERKFALAAHPPPERLAGMVRCEITQVYLCEEEPGVERRVRRYVERGASRYELTTKQRLAPTVRIELEVPITAERYAELVACEQASGTAVVRKTRHSFVEAHRVWVLDEVHEPVPGWFCEAELEHPDEVVAVPAWLGEAVEVTTTNTMATLAQGTPGV